MSCLISNRQDVYKRQQLLDEINSRQYKIGKSICYVVRYPRYSEVFAGQFRDRIIHHYIALRLEPLFESQFSDRKMCIRDRLMAKVLAEVTGSISFSQKGDKGQKGALMREHKVLNRAAISIFRVQEKKHTLMLFVLEASGINALKRMTMQLLRLV